MKGSSFQVFGTLHDILLFSLDKAHQVTKLKTLAFSQQAPYLPTSEQGMVLSLVPGMCMHASLFLQFAH